ncbi:6-phosphogluconate dehydrogenase NAD-binding protein [Kribbella flavida DSM 17836]|uniref:6-phosphogluconate dehydrogenase NAD-binding protein n=2 Tax=Kribbella flavida TaxID=182640 RepID=D2PME9_KRIFD|nr:6-phosphogluconate dehydrogenase NAD-binding protein [Kribbella flavida DSM 17836]
MHNDITVIGLGEMGSALAGALVGAGHRVTVWNRSRGKAAALTDRGATAAHDAAAAVAASPVVLVCVSDYAATRAILEAPGVGGQLAGRVLVQLSTGTPQDARELDELVRGLGAEYLDGAILAWPRQIGTPDAYVAVSGPEATFRRVEKLLLSVAGAATYAGPRVTGAAAQFAATLAYLAGHWIGFAHGARIYQAEGFGVEQFGRLLAGLGPILAADNVHMATVVAENRFTDPESTLRTAGHDIQGLVRQAAEAGIDDTFPAFAAAVFERAVAAGYGDEEHVAVIKTMR